MVIACEGLGFDRLRSGPFEGPAIVIPPALPEDTYCAMADNKTVLHSLTSVPCSKYLYAMCPRRLTGARRKRESKEESCVMGIDKHFLFRGGSINGRVLCVKKIPHQSFEHPPSHGISSLIRQPSRKNRRRSDVHVQETNHQRVFVRTGRQTNPPSLSSGRCRRLRTDLLARGCQCRLSR
jgi:hypothetical protein